MMKIRELIDHISPCRVKGDLDQDIKSLEMDSRLVSQGALFFCIRGFTVDGHEYAPQAAERGAVAFLTEEELPVDGTQIIVRDSRRAMAQLAARFYNYPSDRMTMVGVTGTNGKTSVTHFIQDLLKRSGAEAGMIGTMYTELKGVQTETVNTTPESFTLQKRLNEMYLAGAEAVTMEVSSHALHMGRVHGTAFDVAVFTNLSQDHLDYHQTMDQYAQAKSLLFSQLGSGGETDARKRAVINVDDSYADVMLGASAVPVITYGIEKPCDVRAEDIIIKPEGIRFTIRLNQESYPVQLKLAGTFSVYNALAAFAAVYALGIEPERAARFLSELPQVRGRFERVETDAPIHVIVDYAHTPDGLENVIRTAKDTTEGPVTVVFGCGGDRDRKKRPIMGKLAEDLADYVILTSDNPRSENPDAIIQDILSGMNKENHTVQTDRQEAIRHAIMNATEGEVIVVAGKGHETYQITGDVTIDFDDRKVSSEAVKERFS